MTQPPAPPQEYMGVDALRLTVTTGELRAISNALDVLGIEHGNALLTWRDASPWLEIDVAVCPEVAQPFPPPPHDLIGFYTTHAYRLERLAMWRFTRAVYKLDTQGAVEDDPIPGCEGTLR